MNIERISGLNNVYKPKKSDPVRKTEATRGKDTVSLSPEARANAEIEKYKEIARNAPEIRTDRVNELKAKINNPEYLNDEGVLRSLTDRIAESLGLK